MGERQLLIFLNQHMRVHWRNHQHRQRKPGCDVAHKFPNVRQNMSNGYVVMKFIPSHFRFSGTGISCCEGALKFAGWILDTVRNGSVLDIGILSTGSKGSAPALGCCSTRPRVEYLSPSVRGEAPRTTREARVLPISAPRHHQAETAVADSASARLGRLQFRAQSNSRQRQNSSGYHP